MMIFISLHPYGDRINFYAGMGWAFTSGLSVFSYMSGPAFMSKSLFGAKAQGANLGYISLAYAVGFAIGAPLFGVIKGATSFTTAWGCTISFVTIGFISSNSSPLLQLSQMPANLFPQLHPLSFFQTEFMLPQQGTQVGPTPRSAYYPMECPSRPPRRPHSLCRHALFAQASMCRH